MIAFIVNTYQAAFTAYINKIFKNNLLTCLLQRISLVFHQAAYRVRGNRSDKHFTVTRTRNAACFIVRICTGTSQDNEIQGAVVVQFIVDKGGMVSDVEAISGPQELRDEAVRVIKKSGKWTPAVQNGRQVKSYKKQPGK